ncbi:MAG: YqgE/AlgH family protein [Pelagibacteraceae bacterium]|jgi:putative transcriptional regulator|nr:YqgE/AlgH family protein [Pelagibacteraceae bacterium]HJL58326.1 YqgE/AlgH family protein [Alphaproteobacteria bacterium]MBO6469176.1 YqgE/AlgH family protein [Pelagibacteraceae bacterium]MBO6470622.1 YqgE/AlgH family protein [Pelagibacteraceae bacterium]MBO6471484.1 YqgE/AlgH family protein [Pelagibacteraceae bacterium]|tara:strand:+ start:932 stop:1513 length:582 start_codon:yes stop_codon:yes gene_type:complete
MRFLFLFLILFFSFQQNALSESIFTELLVAKPSMQDPRFKETVIVMLYHNQEEGAAGLVINKPIDTLSIRELFNSSSLSPPEKIVEKEITVYWGGPVDPQHIFFIHSSDYKSSDFISSNNDFTITREPKVLFDIAKNKGPKEYIILLGIAVWESGQLDSEMMRGDWDKKLNNYTPLFDNGKEMWSHLISSRDI